MIADKYTKRWKTSFLSEREGYCVIEEASNEIVAKGPFTYLEAQNEADRLNHEHALERM